MFCLIGALNSETNETKPFCHNLMVYMAKDFFFFYSENFYFYFFKKKQNK
jgi:hypothetical protein